MAARKNTSRKRNKKQTKKKQDSQSFLKDEIIILSDFTIDKQFWNWGLCRRCRFFRIIWTFWDNRIYHTDSVVYRNCFCNFK